MFAGFAEAFKQSEFNQTGNDIEILTGRKPTSVNIFLKKVYFGCIFYGEKNHFISFNIFNT